MTGVPKSEVGLVVQDFVDSGATRVRADRDSDGTYTVVGGAGDSGGGVGVARVAGVGGGSGLVTRSLPAAPAPQKADVPVIAAATYADYLKAQPATPAKRPKARTSLANGKAGRRKSGKKAAAKRKSRRG